MKTLSLAALVLLGVACTPATTSTTVTTAADVPAAKEAAAPEPAAPAGRLICRAKSATEGTVELYDEGNEGTLRRIAPSGNIETKPVHLEHLRWMIIADEPNATDLAVHAATVREQNGKHYVRLGDWQQTWASCD